MIYRRSVYKEILVNKTSRLVVLFTLLAMAASETPYLRSTWARAAFNKMQHQLEHETSNHTEWYEVKKQELPTDLADTFLGTHQDETTTQFIQLSFEKSDWVFTQLYHSMAKSLLTWFMTHTSVNGLLYRGSMFVFSTPQFRALLGVDETWQADRLLDLGAGDGNVTLQMAPLFKEIDVTEMSPVMRWRLSQHGFNVVDVESWSKSGKLYDVIACLNLLDRCQRPISLLREIRSSLKPDTGRLVLALVIPFKQYVEATSDHKAVESLHLESGSFEQQVAQLMKDVFVPAGFRLVRWTRMPYLCEGDLGRGFYQLNDVVLVLKPGPLPHSQSSQL